MIRLKHFLFVVLFVYVGVSAKQNPDSTKKVILNVNEAVLLKDQQQKQIDSLVKIQLKIDLQDAVGDKKKTEALEKQLREIMINDSLRNIDQLKQINALKKTARGYPVYLNNDTLFFIYTRTGSFSAAERARSISGKIEVLYDDPFFKTDSIRISHSGDSYDIIYKNDDILLSIANLDGLWFGKSNGQLAAEYLQKIKETIVSERKSHSLVNWLKRIGFVLLIILVLSLIVKGINYLFKRSENLIKAKKQQYNEGFRIQKIKILTPAYLENGLIRLNNIVRIVVILLMIYFSLPLLFSIFPETETWASTLINWVLAPLKKALNGIIHYLPNLFTILVIYFLFKYALKAIRYFFYEIKKGEIRITGFHSDWAIPTFNILRFVLYAFMLVIIFPYLPGSGSPAFQGVSVFLGILISLGSSSAITNMVAGLVITYMRPFRLGDRVKIGEVTGDVIEKTMLVTRIRTIKNEDVTVPNSTVLSSSTVNYSSQTRGEAYGLIVHCSITLGYDTDWRKIYDTLISAALKTAYIEQEPKPFVLQTALNDFAVSYQINAHTREANKQAVIYSSLMENIQDAMNAAGIEILSPNYNVIRKEDK
ncbi:mechanosensitive ion channel family protein [Pedobacter nototheniae]|uniref:mechanosensitive ion channel family protein n=1 Tax=Pedobacter nototheniae TaxID=2488994 RepID=UPI00292DA59F|nr:mechanosensitive ion channel family protein [Pedobacter nototheniae]